MLPSEEYIFRLKNGRTYTLAELEQAGLSYVPCYPDSPIFSYKELRDIGNQITLDDYRKKADNKIAWTLAKWKSREDSGVQIFTGRNSTRIRDGIPYFLTDFDIEKLLIDTYPQDYEKILSIYRNNADGAAPVETKTKSGGMRLSVYTPKMSEKISFVNHDDDMLIEIFSNKGLSRYDNRYTIESGCLLDIPFLSVKAACEIYDVAKEIGKEKKARQGVADTVDIDGAEFPENIEYGTDGKSPYYPIKFCAVTQHRKSPETQGKVQYTQYSNGGEKGHCFDCDETWWKIKPKQTITTGKQHRHSPTDEDIQRIIDQAPHVEAREQPSHRHFTQEQRIVAEQILNTDPDAGWHYDPQRNAHIPIWTPKYEHLSKLLPNKFAMNGHPTEIERRRVWQTHIEPCTTCGGDTLKSIDRYLLTAHRYCDKCHTDTLIGSYLQYELERKISNSIVSEYQGYLANAPEFQDFRLWQPGTLTFLGAAMGTGKTTEIIRTIRQLAEEGRGTGIIAVPRISLAEQLLRILRTEDGDNAWGGFYQGVKNDKFIGHIGAITCLPSLPNALSKIDQDVNIYLAIDEIDFAYQLTSLAKEQATAVKKTMRECLHTTGLVIAGQTIPTLALEALIQEFQPEEAQGFYNTAPPATGEVTLHKVLCDNAIQNSILASVEKNIKHKLDDGLTPYVFCNTRKDAHVLAERFKEHTPLILDKHTKLFRENIALMENKKLKNHGMLLATSTAAVGISIHDPKAHTIIETGLLHGSRHMDTVAQEAIRVRDSNAQIDIHTNNSYKLALPQAPSETSQADLKHENVKQVYQPDAYINAGASRFFATQKAMLDLADHQPEDYIKHHLGNIGSRKITETEQTPDTNKVIEIKSTRKAVTDREKEAVKEKMKKIFEMGRLQPDWVTRSQHLVKDIPLRIAHSKAAKLATAIGWDDSDWDESTQAPRQLNEEQTQLAIKIALADINIDTLHTQRRGFSALYCQHFVRETFIQDSEEATIEWVEEGLGRELHGINFDESRGAILHKLLHALEGKIFSEKELAEKVWEAIKDVVEKLKNGELLGAAEAKRARFLYKNNTEYIANWTCQFIETWSPLRIAKRLTDVDGNNDAQKHNHTLNKQEHYDLRLDAFNAYLKAKGHTGEMVNPNYNLVDLPAPHNAQKERAKELRATTNMTIKKIATELDVHPNSISKWCKGIQKTEQTEQEQKKEQAQELRATTNMTIKEIATELDVHPNSISKWCKGIQKTEQTEQEQKKEQAQELKREGWTIKTIAAELGKDKSTISRWCKGIQKTKKEKTESTDKVEVVEAEIIEGEPKSDIITDMIYCADSQLYVEKPVLALPPPSDDRCS